MRLRSHLVALVLAALVPVLAFAALVMRENAQVQLAATDPASALKFRHQPVSMVIGSGSASFGRLRVTPKKRFWRGPARTHQFEVAVRPEGPESPLVLRGTMLQEALLPRWAPLRLDSFAAPVRVVTCPIPPTVIATLPRLTATASPFDEPPFPPPRLRSTTPRRTATVATTAPTAA